jgi:hypothetical protein
MGIAPMLWPWKGEEPGGEDRIDFITGDLAVGSLVAALDRIRCRRAQANPHSVFLCVIREYSQYHPAEEDRVGGRTQP